MIKVKNLSFYSSSDGTRKKIFSSLNFEIHENEWVGFLAPDGAGKSALLKSVANPLPHEGEIISDSVEKLNCVYIPRESSSLQWLNVKENIKLAAKISGKTLAPEKLQNIISTVGLEGYEEHIPNHKSKGFRLRITLAQTIAAAPQLVALDEVLSEIKADSKSEIIELLKKINEQKLFSVLFASSSVNDLISVCDKIIFLGGSPVRVLGELNLTNDIEADRTNVFNFMKNILPEEKGILI